MTGDVYPFGVVLGDVGVDDGELTVKGADDAPTSSEAFGVEIDTIEGDSAVGETGTVERFGEFSWKGEAR